MMLTPAPAAIDETLCRRLARIRCVAFDAVGTLIYADPPVSAVYHRIAAAHGSRLTEAELRARFPAALERNEAADGPLPEGPGQESRLATSEPREQRRWREIVAAVIDDADDPEACFRELFDWFGTPAAWSCYADAGPALADLAGMGYRTALASNFDARLLSVCAGLSGLRPLDPRVISSLVGWRKPAAGFYRALLDQSGCTADKALMVGDDWQNDVEGARRAGLAAVIVRRPSREPSVPALADLRELVELLRPVRRG